ncbi:MAG: hypothetical protein ACFFC7_20770, partial [Candidatus Hermodarchaeota archaeon]
EKLAQVERLRGIEFQKMEQEFFKAQIDNMATEAARMAREYELEMQKAIKEGKIVEECMYPKVIEIYKKIKELLIEKGWNKEAAIYDDTIDVYIQKFENDKKIRQIEAEKAQKQIETEEVLEPTEEKKALPRIVVIQSILIGVLFGCDQIFGLNKLLKEEKVKLNSYR